mgnify:CR=1 FL=1
MYLLSSAFTDRNQIIIYIEDGINRLRNVIKDILSKIKGLRIISMNNNVKSFPYGLPNFTRSVSWIVEKSLVQNLMKYRRLYGIRSINLPSSELEQYDCLIEFNGNPLRFYINIKTSDIKAENRYDDISKARRLIEFLAKIGENPLLIVTVKVEFIYDGIIFHPDKTIIYNVAWLKDFKYNPHNRNLQTRTLYAERNIEKRLNYEFIQILKQLINTSS